MTAYAELQVTSNFSFLRGGSHPEELVLRAAELGLSAIALTDRNTLAGVVRAHVAAKEVGIRFVVGARLDLRPGKRPSDPSLPGRRVPEGVDAVGWVKRSGTQHLPWRAGRLTLRSTQRWSSLRLAGPALKFHLVTGSSPGIAYLCRTDSSACGMDPRASPG